MNEGKPDWYKVARRQGQENGRQGRFSPELRGSVLRKVSELEGRKRRGFMMWRRAMAVLVVVAAAVLVVAVLPEGGRLFGGEEASRTSAAGVLGERLVKLGEGEIAVPYGLLEGERLEKGESMLQGKPLLPGFGSKYHPIGTPERMAVSTIPYSDINIIDSKQMEGIGTIVKFKLKSSSDFRPEYHKEEFEYHGFTYDTYTGPNVLYLWGLGMAYDFKHEVVRLFGEEMLKISSQSHIDGIGFSTNYIRKQGDRLETVLHFAYPVMYERDLDGDGIEELIAVSGKENGIYIFKMRDYDLYYASMRELLGAEKEDSVHYEPGSGIFSIVKANDGGQADYAYAEGKDKLVPVGRKPGSADR